MLNLILQKAKGREIAMEQTQSSSPPSVNQRDHEMDSEAAQIQKQIAIQKEHIDELSKRYQELQKKNMQLKQMASSGYNQMQI